jgi:hypothetical protein
MQLEIDVLCDWALDGWDTRSMSRLGGSIHESKVRDGVHKHTVIEEEVLLM